MKKFLGKIIGDRRIVGGLLLIIQMCLFIWLLNNIFLIFPWVDFFCTILSIIIVVWIVRKNDNPSYKIPWIYPWVDSVFIRGLWSSTAIVSRSIPSIGALWFRAGTVTPFYGKHVVVESGYATDTHSCLPRA